MSTQLTAPTKVEADPITTALVAAGVTSAAIEQLEKDYGALAARTEPIETPEEYEVIKRAQLAHRDIRTAVTAALKQERDEAIKYQKFVLQEEKRILAQIAKTEDPLKKLREDYDKREELRALEAAKAHAERMEARRQAVYDTGFTFNGSHYLCDRENGEQPWVLSEDQITGLNVSETLLFTFLDQCAAELKATREIKAEAESKAEEERLAKEAAQKAEADRIAAAQAELERKQREMEEKERQMNARINEARKNELLAMGMRDGTWSECVFLTREGGGYTYPTDQLHAFEKWEEEKALLKQLIEDRDKREREAREKAEQERIAREEALKAEAAQRAVEAERLRLAQEQEAKEKAQKLLEQQEREKALRASDKEKVIAFSTKMSNMTSEIPELKSLVGQHVMQVASRKLTDIVTMLAKLEL